MTLQPRPDQEFRGKFWRADLAQVWERDMYQSVTVQPFQMPSASGSSPVLTSRPRLGRAPEDAWRRQANAFAQTAFGPLFTKLRFLHKSLLRGCYDPLWNSLGSRIVVKKFDI